MLGGRFPPDTEGAGGIGLRAFCNIPRGVEEVLIGVRFEGSETDRREGTRWVFEDMGPEPPAGTVSSEGDGEGEGGLVDRGSCWAIGPLAGGVAIAGRIVYLRAPSMSGR